ncbi:hypothetical protein LTR04_006448, partial [Oleoguttula sp. CCFEE 6159]
MSFKTYPTGYAQYAANGLFGGVDRFTQVDLTAPATCTATRTSIVLPASTDAASFFYAIPSGDINLEVLPPPFLDYLMEFPTVQEQFAYQNLSRCRDPDSSTNTAIGNTQVIVTLARVSIATGAPTLLPPPPDSIPTTTADSVRGGQAFDFASNRISHFSPKFVTSSPKLDTSATPNNDSGAGSATVKFCDRSSSSSVLCLSFNFDTGIKTNNSTGSSGATVESSRVPSSSGVLCLSFSFDTGINANNSTGS